MAKAAAARRQRRETLIEHSPDGVSQPKEFAWSGEAAGGFTLYVEYRDGWGLVRKELLSAR